jgi:hypothetical protein
MPKQGKREERGRVSRVGTRTREQIEVSRKALQVAVGQLEAVLKDMGDMKVPEVRIDGINRIDRAVSEALGFADDALEFMRRIKRNKEIGLPD